jgi:hypothetical protein
LHAFFDGGNVGIVFGNFDTVEFWKKSTYADAEYVDEPVTDECVANVEARLRFRLPAAYVELMRHQNGGIPKRTCHATNERTSWSHDHVAISGIYSIGFKKRYSLCGDFDNNFWSTEWGYPEIGIYFANCPSAGHDMLCLDYRACGPEGEPTVVHVDQEWDYKITVVAPDFESFIRGLKCEDSFEI